MDAALNVACAGGEPLALTDCLNFGNPEKPEIAWELEQAIEGISRAADELGIPVVSGNVSLYNETGGRPIPPTPVVGCVGLVRDVTRIPDRWQPRRRVCLLRGEGAELVRFVWQNARTLLARARHVERRARARAARGRRAGRVATCARDRRCSRATACSSPRAEPARVGRRRRAGDRLMCGVFGVRAPARDVARLTYFGLHALQHRGQESAGIAVSEDGRLTALRDLGLVAQVFDERSLSGLHGELAIGHTRYSTTGGNGWENAQPLLHHGRVRTVALGHNGNLVNAEALRETVGKRLGSSSDSRGDRRADRRRRAAARAGGAGGDGAARRAPRRSSGSRTGRLFAFRDAHGFRPLVLGRLGDDPVDRVRDVRARPRRRRRSSARSGRASS